MSGEKKYLGSNVIMFDKKTISRPVDSNVTRARREYTTHAKDARARVSNVVLFTAHICC